MWERACSRMRCISLHMHPLTHRIREQARSHIGTCYQIQTQKNANPRVGVFVQRLAYHCGFLRPKPGR